MATREVTVSPSTTVFFEDDSRTIPTSKGPVVISALEVGDSVCVLTGTNYVEIVSIP